MSELQGNISPAVELQGSINHLKVLLLSAYGIAVKNGFEGTEEEWLASLKGEPGAPGQPGADGKDGTPATDEQIAAAVGEYIVVQDEEPADAKVGTLWVDTDDEPEGLSPLTFTGAVNASYNGTQAVTVEIPGGGGASGGGGSDSLIVKYVHSDNKAIQPTALDLTTGVFTCVEHGLTTGENAIVVPDACYSYIPFELLSTRRISVGNPKVRVLDADTFVLQYDGADITYPHEVNTSIDVSKWHIEVGKNAVLVFDGFSADSVEVYVHGFYWSTGNYSIEMKPMANNKTIPALLDNNYMSVPGANTTICTFISGVVRIGRGYEMNAFTLSPPTSATDYTYLQKYPTNMGFNSRNVGTKTNFAFPLKREGEITAFRVCMGNNGQFGSLLANGFTVEVYRCG